MRNKTVILICHRVSHMAHFEPNAMGRPLHVIDTFAHPTRRNKLAFDRSPWGHLGIGFYVRQGRP